jgi:protein O-GlcNAc transferase
LSTNLTMTGTENLVNDLTKLIYHSKFNEVKNLLEPNFSKINKVPMLLNALGISYIETKDEDKAIEVLNQSLKLKSKQAPVYNLLALAYKNKRMNYEAIRLAKKGLGIDRSFGPLYSTLGLAYLQVGQSKLAVENIERSIKYHDKSEHYQLYNGILFAKQHDLSSTNEEFLDLAKKVYDLAFSQISKKSHQVRPIGTKIKLGYLSGDMRQHPVGDFFANIVLNHNKEEFEIYSYDNKGSLDQVNQIIRQNSDSFYDISRMTDTQVSDLIYSHDLDLLIDLAGITDYNRLPVLASKPARKQALWIGYFGTLGMPEVDYLIGDNNTLESGDENWYLEKLYRLPYSYLPGEPWGINQEIRDLPYHKNKYITFGAFNKMPKITPEVMELWAKILNRVPNSKLLFKNTCLGEQMTCELLLKFFQERGLEQERIILESFSPRNEFLDRYNEVDISLDSFPYGGGVTTIESLSMGVPVVTWHGDRWMARASSSYLRVLGHDELVAKTLNDYVDIAVELSANISALENYRKNLRIQIKNSEINAKNFVKHFENAVKEILSK